MRPFPFSQKIRHVKIADEVIELQRVNAGCIAGMMRNGLQRVFPLGLDTAKQVLWHFGFGRSRTLCQLPVKVFELPLSNQFPNCLDVVYPSGHVFLLNSLTVDPASVSI